MAQLHIFAFDADGCLYNLNYSRLIFYILDRYWDFFDNFGRSGRIEESDVDLVEKTIDQILQEIDTVDLSQLAQLTFHNSITNHHFKQTIDLAVLKFKLQNASYSQVSNEEIIPKVLQSIVQSGLQYMEWVTPDILKQIFIKANKTLIDTLVKKIEQENINYYALALGTNRQSFYHDLIAIDFNITGSIYLNLFDLKDCLAASTQDKTGIVNKFSMADIYGDLLRGENYRRILDIYKNDDQNRYYYAYPGYVFDETKLSLIYAIAHDAIHILDELHIDSDAEINIDFFEDREDILATLKTVLMVYPQLIPRKIHFNFYHYNGDQLALYFSMDGAGELDRNYRENVKLIAKLCGHDLQNALIAKLYTPELEKIMDAAPFLDIKKFLSLRTLNQETQSSMRADFMKLFYCPPKENQTDQELAETINKFCLD